MKYLYLILLFLFTAPALAQPRIEWQRVLGGNGNEEIFDMIATKDGGLLIVGYTTSSQNGDVEGINNGDKDYWVVKLDNGAQPNIQWEKNFGTDLEDVAYKVIQDAENEHYLVIGKTGRYVNNNVLDTVNNYDYWLLELDTNGNLLRDKRFGSPYADDYYDAAGLNEITQIELLQTKDKKHLIFLGDNHRVEQQIFYHLDTWWLKMDWNTWDVMAERQYDFDGPQGLRSGSLVSGLVELPNGDFVFCAVTDLLDGQNDEYWIQKIDSNGKENAPPKKFGGMGDDFPRDMIVDSEGNFLVLGQSRSADRNVKGNHRQKNTLNPSVDMWLLKLTQNMDKVLWSKCFGFNHDDIGRSVIQASDGAYYLGGFSQPFGTGGDICAAYGNGEFFIVKLDNSGEIVWTANFGGGGGESVFKMLERNNKLVLAGYTDSNNVDVDANQFNGGRDIWVLQLENLECNSLAQPLPKPQITKTMLGDSVRIGVVNTPFSPGQMEYHWESPQRDTFTTAPFILVPVSDSSVFTVRFKYLCCLSEPSAAVAFHTAGTNGGNWLITPNGDAQNDTFAPTWLLDGNASLRVFNVWGQCVYEADPYNNDWNGSSRGQPLPAGAYLYLVQTKEDGHIYRGTVNIRR